MKYTLLFLLLPFLGMTQEWTDFPPKWKNRIQMKDPQYIILDTSWILVSNKIKDPYFEIDLPETYARIWYVHDFGMLAEYEGPAKVEWYRVPTSEREKNRVADIKAIHLPISLNVDWRMIDDGSQMKWR